MPQMTKKGFKTVETNLEELQEKIRVHRRKVFWRVVKIIAAIVAVIVCIALWTALRSYDTFVVEKSVERTDSEAVKFEEFRGRIMKYSNDGASYISNSNELIWNQAYEMTSPAVDICQGYLAIYDKQGTKIYIMDEAGLK